MVLEPSPSHLPLLFQHQSSPLHQVSSNLPLRVAPPCLIHAAQAWAFRRRSSSAGLFNSRVESFKRQVIELVLLQARSNVFHRDRARAPNAISSCWGWPLNAGHPLRFGFYFSCYRDVTKVRDTLETYGIFRYFEQKRRLLCQNEA